MLESSPDSNADELNLELMNLVIPCQFILGEGAAQSTPDPGVFLRQRKFVLEK
jgi:hypothetical protein